MVWLLPMNTVVNMSALYSRSSCRVMTLYSSPSRPMLRTTPQTVWGDTWRMRMSQALSR